MPPAATKKAAPKKVAATKKAAASKKAAPVEETSTREQKRQENLELGEQIAEMKEAGTSWADISEQLGIGQGKAMLLHMYATVEDTDRITARNDDELGKKISKARESGLSWGQIMARTGLGEGKCRALFEAATGEAAMGNRIGKGGRYPADAERPDKPVKATAKKAVAAKKGGGTATELPAAGTPLGDFTLAQLQLRMNGKTATINRDGGGVERIKVKNVTRKTKDGEIILQDSDGKSRTILATAVKSITK